MTVLCDTDFIDQIESLPALPAIVGRIMSVADSPDSSADDVGKVLSQDQAMAAKVLRVANSPFYGAARTVTQVSRAVVRMGPIAVRNLVVGMCAREALSPSGAQPPEHITLWRHSIAAASAGELIAREVGFKPSEEAFPAALLHDVGQLAMVAFGPDSFRKVLHEQASDTRLLTLERAHLGIDHTEAGFRIFSRWGLPEPLCHVVRRHHDEEIDVHEKAARLLAIVMLADTFAKMMGFAFDVPCGNLRRAEIAAKLLGLTDSDQFHILNGLERRTEEALHMLAPVDSAERDAEARPPKQVVWISSEPTSSYCIGQLLLEHRGYEVRRVSPSGLDDRLSPDDIVILALSEDAAAAKLTSELIRQGHHRIVLLSDPTDAGHICPTLRRRDETGVCCIPWLFTAFDIQWLEEQLGA